MVQHQAVVSSRILGQANGRPAMGVRSLHILKGFFTILLSPYHVRLLKHVQERTYHTGVDQPHPVKGIVYFHYLGCWCQSENRY